VNTEAAINTLLQHLLSATPSVPGQDIQTLQIYAQEFGIAAARWYASNNQQALTELVANAQAQAAIRGIQIQGDVEQFLMRSLQIAGRAAFGA
jgi:hypothetical protein